MDNKSAEDRDAPSEDRKTEQARSFMATLGIVFVLSTITVLNVCGSKTPPDVAERCSTILDRFVALRVRDSNPKASDYVVEQRQVEARAQAQKLHLLELCEDRLTERAAECAERAASADDLERCLL